MTSPQISVVAHNIRSSHNIGSIFRTCDGLGVEHLYISGYSPYPAIPDDTRLPHVAERVSSDISKTALGAEKTVPFTHVTNITSTIDAFKAHGYSIIGLEQGETAVQLPDFQPPAKIMLILGEEVQGIPAEIQKHCDTLIEIPMRGQKESFNVSVAAGIALYALNY
ncbi:MAG: TrmH family RNA methyltransferase [Candidatus Saccharibacteria bacterium]|nr:TrmH family RNA methyltransferase [Candidatus Saccharibacteria bacterium]